MKTQPTNLLLINTNMNLFMHRMHIQGRIEYVENTVNIEPGRAIDIYSGGM